MLVALALAFAFVLAALTTSVLTTLEPTTSVLTAHGIFLVGT